MGLKTSPWGTPDNKLKTGPSLLLTFTWAVLFCREFCASLDYHPIRDTNFLDRSSFNPQISVCVRKRPMNKREIDTKEIDIVSIPDRQKLIVHEPKLKVSTRFLNSRYEH